MVNGKTKIVLAILSIELICSFAYGQEANDILANAVSPPDKWQLNVEPFLWFASVDGHVEARGRKTNVDVSFDDIWDSLDAAAMANIELRKEKWGLFVNPLYMKLSSSKVLVVPGPEDIVLTPNAKVDLTLWMVEFGGFYQLGQWCPSGDSKRTIKLDAIAGGRYWNIDQKVTVGPLSGKVSEDWVDPYIGARVTAPVNDWLTLSINGDVGGFSVTSDASNHATNIFAGAEVRLSRNMGLVGGYRWLNLDRAKSSETNSNITLEGPLVALAIRF